MTTNDKTTEHSAAPADEKTMSTPRKAPPRKLYALIRQAGAVDRGPVGAGPDV